MGSHGVAAKFNDNSNEERKEERDNRRYNDYHSKHMQEIDDHFQKPSDEWRDKMSEQEYNGVYKYTGSSYIQMNQYLRDGKMGSGENPNLEKLILNCQKGLKKFKLDEDLRVYRQSSSQLLEQLGIPSYVGGFWGNKPEFMSVLKSRIGSVVKDHGFTSTSMLKNAWSGDVKYEINIPKGTNCAYVAHMSQHHSEMELLLNRGTSFRITGVREENGHPIVTMKVIKTSGRKSEK